MPRQRDAPPNMASIARRVLIVSLSASISTSLQRTTAPWAISFFSFTRCAGRQARRRRHQFAPHRVAALAVERFARAQVAFGHRRDVAAETVGLPGRLVTQRR